MTVMVSEKRLRNEERGNETRVCAVAYYMVLGCIGPMRTAHCTMVAHGECFKDQSIDGNAICNSEGGSDGDRTDRSSDLLTPTKCYNTHTHTHTHTHIHARARRGRKGGGDNITGEVGRHEGRGY